MLWAMGAILTLSYLINQFNQAKSDIRQQFNSSYDHMQTYIRETNGTLRSIQFMTESYIEKRKAQPDFFSNKVEHSSFVYHPLQVNGDCRIFKEKTQDYLSSFQQLIYFWKDSIAASQGINHVFIAGVNSHCMVDFPIRMTASNIELLKRVVYEYMRTYMSMKTQGQERSLYWIVPNPQPDAGQLYLMAPIYKEGILVGLMGIERNINLSQFNHRYDIPLELAIVNQNNQPVIYNSISKIPMSASMLESIDTPYFGFNNDYSKLIFKKRLSPSALSVALSIPTNRLLAKFNLSLLNAFILNFISAISIVIMIWLLERKMLAPAENNAIRLEEHEQFNHKIVASAPVGIIILRVSDGGNILSNELAHDYFQLLNDKDKQRILKIIREKSSNYIDVVTTNQTHLQISFVNSRYQNEEVAICVFVDISIRVQMEKSLQDVAEAAEQANHAKSMFLATVSHELRTPLYGIIGNIELLQSYDLPGKANRLVKTMDNSSALLLQIISDILDFSKIESKQLKIEHKAFTCREIFSFVLSNYVPLIAKKKLSVYSFIEPNVPDLINNDAVRLQQVISNILNNSIKFTESGFIILYVWRDEHYLRIEIKDSGIGMTSGIQMQLFDPFFQVNNDNNMASKGTGLGLAICEKLASLMDGDIEINSEYGLGSTFIVRIPLYNAKYLPIQVPEYRSAFTIAVLCRNDFLGQYLSRLLEHHGFNVTLIDELHSQENYALLLTDNPVYSSLDIPRTIRLAATYIGEVRLVKQGEWKHNTYQLDRLPTFIDTLMREESNITVIPEDHIQYDGALNKFIVLIVDDHPINRLLLTDQITSMGYRTAMAIDGLDALDYIAKNPVDIVLSDVNMPNMDGYMLATRLREQSFTQPIIGLTANAMAEEKQRCIAAGMDDCLSKPTKLLQLKKTLLSFSKR